MVGAPRQRGDTAHFPGIGGKLTAGLALLVARRPRGAAAAAAHAAQAGRSGPDPQALRGRSAPADSGEPGAPCGSWRELPRLTCGNPQLRSLFDGDGPALRHHPPESSSVVECRACGLLQLAPAPLPEQLGRYYPTNYWFSPDGPPPAPGGILAPPRSARSRPLCHASAAGCGRDGSGSGRGLRRRTVSGACCASAAFPRWVWTFLRRRRGVAWRRNGVPAVCGSLLDTPIAARQLRGRHDVSCTRASPRSQAPTSWPPVPCWSLTESWWCRFRTPPAGSSGCWAARGTASMCRATSSISATAIWRCCWRAAASKCCAASTFRCATIPRGWPPAWPRARSHGAAGAAAAGSAVAGGC